jgi:hypothetical protein
MYREMKGMLMNYKNAAIIGLAVVVLVCLMVIHSGQKVHTSSVARPVTSTAVSDSVPRPAATDSVPDSAGTEASAESASDSGHAENASWSGTRKVEIIDPQYQMTAYTMEIPSDWKFAGTIARPAGCHATGAAGGLKYTAESPDGLTALVRLPGVTWSSSTSEQVRKIAEQQQHCPNIDIDSAASFVVNIAVPNLHPHAKIVSVGPLLPEGQAALAKQLENQNEQNAKIAPQFRPQNVTLEGARVRVQYERDGHPFEEIVMSVVQCSVRHQNAMFRMPASDTRSCTSRGTGIYRAPQGQLDAVLARPEFKAMEKTLTINSAWDYHAAQDQMAKFQQFQAADNARFQANLKANQAQFDQRIQQQKQFDANLRASSDRAIAQDRARQDAIDASAHNMVNYSLDRQDFKNPNTGQTITASSQYNHQWISSDGSTLIQTNDHTLDPNGVVYPVSQSWTELVPK